MEAKEEKEGDGSDMRGLGGNQPLEGTGRKKDEQGSRCTAVPRNRDRFQARSEAGPRAMTLGAAVLYDEDDPAELLPLKGCRCTVIRKSPQGLTPSALYVP
jgi:hypothetical protein